MPEHFSSEKRHSEKRYAQDWLRELNADQLVSLREFGQFGWQVAFVRHPSFHAPVVVLTDGHHTHPRYAILNPNGSLQDKHNLQIRGSKPVVEEAPEEAKERQHQVMEMLKSIDWKHLDMASINWECVDWNDLLQHHGLRSACQFEVIDEEPPTPQA